MEQKTLESTLMAIEAEYLEQKLKCERSIMLCKQSIENCRQACDKQVSEIKVDILRLEMEIKELKADTARKKSNAYSQFEYERAK